MVVQSIKVDSSEIVASLFGRLDLKILEEIKHIETYDVFIFPRGVPILKEDEQPPKSFFYIILYGTAKVCKKSSANDDKTYDITTLGPGEIIGELSLIDNKPHSATVMPIENCTVLRISLETIKNNAQYQFLYTEVLSHLAEKLSIRLLETDEIYIKYLQKNLEIKNKQKQNGLLLLGILVVTCLYGLFLSPFWAINKPLVAATPISFAVLLSYFFVVILAVLLSKQPLVNFGFTTKNSVRALLESLIFSLPLMIAVVLLKKLLIVLNPAFQGLSLIAPKLGLFSSINLFTLNLTVFSYIGYSLVQEFIVRGCLQSTIRNFIEGTERERRWGAIFSSNVLFSVIHAHLSINFSILMFLPGLFWGWLYDRQKTLIGVSLSHILIGLWALFSVGLSQFLQ